MTIIIVVKTTITVGRLIRVTTIINGPDHESNHNAHDNKRMATSRRRVVIDNSHHTGTHSSFKFRQRMTKALQCFRGSDNAVGHPFGASTKAQGSRHWVGDPQPGPSNDVQPCLSITSNATKPNIGPLRGPRVAEAPALSVHLAL